MGRRTEEKGSSEEERTLRMAAKFLHEVRADMERAIGEGRDTPPRLRSVHQRAGHATPEYRTVGIPIPPTADGSSPDILSGLIATYAASKSPERMMLALDVLQEGDGSAGQSMLIAEARDCTGTRRYWMQPYRVDEANVEWAAPLDGGWRDPGSEPMILDAGFRGRER